MSEKALWLREENRGLSRAEFKAIGALPPELEWFANFSNLNTRRAYQRDIRDFTLFVGLKSASEFRQVNRSHVIAWRKLLESKHLSAASIRRKLSALGSLMDHLCESNVIDANPVDGVSRPREGNNEGKTPAMSSEQARLLLDAPCSESLKGKRDRAILACLLFHALRRSELCDLRVKDLAPRMGIQQFSIRGKGGRIRYVSVNPEALVRIEAYLDAAGHREDLKGPLFRPVRNNVSGDLRKHLDPSAIRKSVLIPHARAAGVYFHGLRPHSLRATAITNALENGVDLSRAQDWAGHADPSTTRLYDKRQSLPQESPSFKVEY